MPALSAIRYRDELAKALAGRTLPWQGEFAAVDDLDVHYVEEGTGQPVLLLHGLAGWSFTWRHNLSHLARRHRVIAPDLKGFGLTDKRAPTGYSLDDQAAFVRDFMDTLAIDRAVLVGHSMGGEIALRLALSAPERVQALVLVASAGYVTSVPAQVRRLPHLPLATLLVRLLFMNRRFARRCLTLGYGDPSLVSEATIAGYLLPVATPHAAPALLRVLAEMDFGRTADRIRTVKHPTQIIWGQRDRFTPPRHADRFHAEISGSRLCSFRAVGHMVPEEIPDDFNALVSDFLATVWA